MKKENKKESFGRLVLGVTCGFVALVMAVVIGGAIALHIVKDVISEETPGQQNTEPNKSGESTQQPAIVIGQNDLFRKVVNEVYYEALRKHDEPAPDNLSKDARGILDNQKDLMLQLATAAHEQVESANEVASNTINPWYWQVAEEIPLKVSTHRGDQLDQDIWQCGETYEIRLETPSGEIGEGISTDVEVRYPLSMAEGDCSRIQILLWTDQGQAFRATYKFSADTELSITHDSFHVWGGTIRLWFKTDASEEDYKSQCYINGLHGGSGDYHYQFYTFGEAHPEWITSESRKKYEASLSKPNSTKPEPKAKPIEMKPDKSTSKAEETVDKHQDGFGETPAGHQE